MAIHLCIIGSLVSLSSLYVLTHGQTFLTNKSKWMKSQQQVSQNEDAIRLLQEQILENANTLRLQEEMINALNDTLFLQAELLSILLKANYTSSIEIGSTNPVTVPSTTAAGSIDFEKVSMYAGLTTAFDDQGIIPFDKVYTNIGDRYQKTTGYFICPVDGIYIFSWSVEAKSSDISTTLRVNEHDVATLTAHPDTRYDSDSSTQTVAVNMKVGDKAGVYLTSGSAQPRSSFSGWKVKNNNKDTVLHAVLSRDTSSGTLKFDEVLFNKDNCYSKSTGRYKPKEKGTYFFCLSIKGQEKVKNVGKLVFKVGTQTHGILVDAEGPDTFDIGTICMAVVMNVGDYVYAEHFPNKVLGMHTTLTGLRVDEASEMVPSFAATTIKTFTSTMIFETEVSDSGIYSTYTGKAVMPSDGIYVFTWNSKSYNDNDVVSQIMVNGEPRGERLADSKTNKLDVSTGFAILELRRNDAVHIKVKSGVSQGYASNFSGFRLHKT